MKNVILVIFSVLFILPGFTQQENETIPFVRLNEIDSNYTTYQSVTDVEKAEQEYGILFMKREIDWEYVIEQINEKKWIIS